MGDAQRPSSCFLGDERDSAGVSESCMFLRKLVEEIPKPGRSKHLALPHPEGLAAPVCSVWTWYGLCVCFMWTPYVHRVCSMCAPCGLCVCCVDSARAWCVLCGLRVDSACALCGLHVCSACVPCVLCGLRVDSVCAPCGLCMCSVWTPCLLRVCSMCTGSPPQETRVRTVCSECAPASPAV